MILFHFLTGLVFEGLGLAAYLQLRRQGDFPLKRELPWLAAFGFVGGAAGWTEMFLISNSITGAQEIMSVMKVILHLLTGLLLFRFGWGMLTHILPLPAWSIFIPGFLVVPIAYIITYAVTTFITPSPITIPIEIWTRYLLYLPGSVMAGIGFLRLWHAQKQTGIHDVARLMLGGGLAFLFEALVIGLIVPAAPAGPASYYNYDRVLTNAFGGDTAAVNQPYGLIPWLDYPRVLQVTGLPIESWRLFSAVIVTLFVIKTLDVFETIRKRQVEALLNERDQAQQATIHAQVAARQSAERWTNTLINISRGIANLEHVDDILIYIVQNVAELLQADYVALALLNRGNSPFTQECLDLKCFFCEAQTRLVSDSTCSVSNALVTQAIQANSVYRTTEDEPVNALDGLCSLTDYTGQAAAISPVRLDGTPIGALWIVRFNPRKFTDTDMIWLESITNQVEIAIQHGVMTSQLQSLSIIEERNRIGREMHDGLAQVLGYLNLQVQTLGSLLEQGKMAQFQEELSQMRQAIQTANADVRENILSLRTTLAQEKGLAVAVEEFLSEFGYQTGVETRLDYRLEGGLNLSSLAEVQLVCILQEALTNVRKHARAQRVLVEIDRLVQDEQNFIFMTVIDDGIGFVQGDSKRHFGLQTMRERASSVGGCLQIISQPNQGCRVECRMPCLEAQQIPRRSVIVQ